MVTCAECGLPFDGLLDDVACDGCHRFFHRNCTNGYVLIDVSWADTPQAFIFCKGCED